MSVEKWHYLSIVVIIILLSRKLIASKLLSQEEYNKNSKLFFW